MGANFTPNHSNYKQIGDFRFWCQKVLPLVYTDAISYYETLCQVTHYLNETISNVGLMGNDITETIQAYEKLQEYVNNYFSSLEVQKEIDEALDEMARDGTLSKLIAPYVVVAGMPIMVDSVEQMVDREKLYLLSADSKIYGYNKATNSWIHTSSNYGAVDEVTIMRYRGNLIDLGFTSFVECRQRGYYSFTQDDIPNITDCPVGVIYGGICVVFDNAATGQTFQFIKSTTGTIWFRYGSNAFEDILGGSGVFKYIGKVVNQPKTNVESTSFLNCTTVGFYNFTQAELSEIEDKPDGLDTGGIVQVFSPWGTGGVCRIIIGNYGKCYIRTFAVNNWTQFAGEGVGSSDTKYCALGDSITKGYYSADGQIAGITNSNYPYYVGVANGWKVDNKGVGSQGYVQKARSDLGGQNARELVSSIDFSEYDVVTLAYGVNDWHYDAEIGNPDDDANLGTTMCSNMKACIRKIMADNPYCKIVVITPANASAFGGDYDSDYGYGYARPATGKTLKDVVDAQIEICKNYNIPYIDQSVYGTVNRFNINSALPDGVHPALKFYKTMGKSIAKQIQFY